MCWKSADGSELRSDVGGRGWDENITAIITWNCVLATKKTRKMLIVFTKEKWECAPFSAGVADC